MRGVRAPPIDGEIGRRVIALTEDTAAVETSSGPSMWRVQWPDGSLSDMANLSRANDAAARFNETTEREQRGRQRAAGRPYNDQPPAQTGLTHHSSAHL
jgi:hypothetical protein